MAKKKIVSTKKSTPAKALKKNNSAKTTKKTSAKTSKSIKKATLPKLTAKNLEMLFSFFDFIKEFIPGYDERKDYTFLPLSMKDKLNIEAREEYDRFKMVIDFFFKDKTDDQINEIASLLDVDSKKLKSFIAREPNKAILE